MKTRQYQITKETQLASILVSEQIKYFIFQITLKTVPELAGRSAPNMCHRTLPALGGAVFMGVGGSLPT